MAEHYHNADTSLQKFGVDSFQRHDGRHCFETVSKAFDRSIRHVSAPLQSTISLKHTDRLIRDLSFRRRRLFENYHQIT